MQIQSGANYSEPTKSITSGLQVYRFRSFVLKRTGPRQVLLFYLIFILVWVETESTWYYGHCLAYCTSPG
jgi:hypothetical protein